jgi:hypothetical protein
MQIDRKVVEQALEAMDKATRYMSDSDYVKLNHAIDVLRDALAQPYHVPQTFEDFLATDAGVRMGLKLKDEWIDAARAGWEAAMRAKQENV